MILPDLGPSTPPTQDPSGHLLQAPGPGKKASLSREERDLPRVAPGLLCQEELPGIPLAKSLQEADPPLRPCSPGLPLGPAGRAHGFQEGIRISP